MGQFNGLKKKIPINSHSKMEEDSKRFNKRAFLGSIIIHVFFFLIRLPHLELDHKLKVEPKLIPIIMESFKRPMPIKNPEVKNVVIAAPPEVLKPTPKPKPIEPIKKIDNGTDRVVKKADKIGDRLSKNTEPVQKGDPKSNKKTAFDPKKDLRKLPKNDVGTGAAPSKVKAKSPETTGGSGDTYKGEDFTNLTDSLMKKGKGLKRLKSNKNNPDDGGAGGGTGGGMGDGVGGGAGDGHFTGTTNGTTNLARVADNVGSLTGKARGKIDSQKGFDGLATKGSVMVAGVSVERMNIPSIDSEEIRRILRDHIPQFRSCYQRELDNSKSQDGAGMTGRMDFRFGINNSGRVVHPEITSKEITSDKVRDCIRDVLQGIGFPSPKGGGTVDVYQPMNFYPKRS